MKKIISFLLCIIIVLQANSTVFAKPLNKATEKKPCVISAIGDSITYAQTYAAVLDMLPEINVKNYGICATQVAGLADSSFVNRTKNVRFNSDYILVFGGTNDYMGDKAMCNPLGMPDSTDTITYFGAYNAMIKNLKKYNPKSKIVIVTPIRRKNWDMPNDYGLGLQHYALATKMIAEQNGLPCIDLFNEPSCDFTGTDILIDGIHPSIKGHTVIATVIYQQLYAMK